MVEVKDSSVDKSENTLLVVSRDRDLFTQVAGAFASVEREEIDFPVEGLLKVRSKRYSVVFIDIDVESESIESLLRAYRKAGAEGIILLVDAFSEPQAIRLKQAGLIEDYLVKPLKSSELRAIVGGGNSKRTPNGDIGRDRLWLFVREVIDLINVVGLGLDQLLERICWSAIFLLGVKSARVELMGRVAEVGKAGEYEVSFPITDAGKEIGELKFSADGVNVRALSENVKLIELLIGPLAGLAKTHTELQELANTDPLTGLVNRRYMYEVLQNLFERAKEEDFQITFIIFDFDDFKHYNDTYGHSAGDEILREAALLIKKCIRSKDIACRFGGDEFAVVLWDYESRRVSRVAHPRSALVIMERFRKLLRRHYFPCLGSHGIGGLTISGGLATYPRDARTMDELIEKADSALLEAKRSGKDRIVLVGNIG